MKTWCMTGLAVAGLASATAASAETAAYTYDAKGRLVKVIKVNATYTQVVVETTYDKADNRKRVNTAASHLLTPPPHTSNIFVASERAHRQKHDAS